MDAFWILGDTSATLFNEELKKLKQKQQLFIFDNYDVKYLSTPVALNGNVLIKIRDALVDGLNSFNKLPRVTLVLIDRDFPKFSEFADLMEKGFSLVIHSVLLTNRDPQRGSKGEMF